MKFGWSGCQVQGPLNFLPVDNFFAVEVIEAAEDLVDVIAHQSLWKAFCLLLDSVVHIFPLAEILHDVHVVLVLEDFVDFDDVRMVLSQSNIAKAQENCITDKMERICAKAQSCRGTKLMPFFFKLTPEQVVRLLPPSLPSFAATWTTWTLVGNKLFKERLVGYYWDESILRLGKVWRFRCALTAGL